MILLLQISIKVHDLISYCKSASHMISVGVGSWWLPCVGGQGVQQNLSYIHFSFPDLLCNYKPIVFFSPLQQLSCICNNYYNNLLLRWWQLIFFCLYHNCQEWSCPEAGEVLKRNSVPDWPLIATYLISEARLMKSSKWSNYISALPRQPYSLLYW